ncbi:hypothetical protein HX017_00565 [Myroides marinus]|jgi:nitrite reductase/ring-hydroxylating ferredoxin subunit|uniref:Rieske domain-containing protein n=1 Tax=Myroides marinus TaxID=703342 RepID=A0A1H6RFV4_9FLAO|nr:hypothetical protein [Myroides marinus]MDR0196498.1 hypothetical protein [Myroides sp.]MDM1345521.1 hypothetical protein [Myroides marinus]MDM1349110.1 hypothetical protein [Myroides marinus]MDM1352756.1 hypothetical protein [Myroides marinus]MDM1356320.1 hypothetical protein [Myroides marinus]
MKKIFLILFTIVITISCSKSNNDNNYPNIPVVNINFDLNLNLPSANDLRVPNGTYIDYNHGYNGIAIVNNVRYYSAWELTCPDHNAATPCSKLVQKKKNDIYVYCQCKDKHNGQEAQFSLITGQSMTPGLKYVQLKPYPVYESNGALRIRY